MQRPIGPQYPNRNRQIESRTLFLQVRWSQVDRDPRRRNIEAGVLDRRPHPVATLPHRRIRQPHRAEYLFVQLDPGEVDFDIDDVCVDSIHCRATCCEEH